MIAWIACSVIIFANSWISVTSEVRKLIPICSANSCLNPTAHWSKNCHCDSKCSLIYNDCCLDAPYRAVRAAMMVRQQSLDCVFVHGENRHFLMIGSCKDTWSGRVHVKEKCEGSSAVATESSDVLGSVPVTNPVGETTYKNYYCGICNDQRVEDLVEWRVKALCASKEIKDSDIRRNLTYIEDKKQWGVWKQSSNSERSFHECHFLFQRPVSKSGIRQCVPNMVSRCPPSWKDMATRRKCKSYVDPVTWSRGLVYKNMDCAACHNLTGNNFHCLYDVARASSDIMLGLATSIDFSTVVQ